MSQSQQLADMETHMHLTNPRGSAPKTWPAFKGEPPFVPPVLGGDGEPVLDLLTQHPRVAPLLFKVPPRHTVPVPSPLRVNLAQHAPSIRILSPASDALTPQLPPATSGDPVAPRRRSRSGRRGSMVLMDGAAWGDDHVLQESVRSLKALDASEFGPQPVVQYGPSIPEYLRHNAFAFPPSLHFNPRHPAMVLPLPLLFAVFRYFAVADLFAFSQVDWAAKDRVDEYLLYSSLVLGASRTTGLNAVLTLDALETMSASSSDSDLSAVLAAARPRLGSGRRRYSLISGSLVAPRGGRKMSLSSADGGDVSSAAGSSSELNTSISSRALALTSMRAEIARYHALVGRLKAKLDKRKAQLGRLKAETAKSNTKTIKVMQQLANKNDALRLALADERQASAAARHQIERLQAAKNELSEGAAASSVALDDALNKNRALATEVRELKAQLAQAQDQATAARTSAAVIQRGREMAEARVSYLETLGFEGKAAAALATIDAMRRALLRLRGEKYELRLAVRNLSSIFSAHHMALKRTLALAAPALERSDVALAELRSEVLNPLNALMSRILPPAPAAGESGTLVGAPSGFSGSVDFLDADSLVAADAPEVSTDEASLAYLRLADPHFARASLEHLPDPDSSGAMPSPLDHHLAKVVERLLRSRARSKLLLFCAQYMGKRYVTDPLRWGAAVFIQTWWRHVTAANSLGGARASFPDSVALIERDARRAMKAKAKRDDDDSDSTSSSTSDELPLVPLRSSSRKSKVPLPPALPYWHDRYEPARITMDVEAIDIDLLIRRITAPAQRDTTLTRVVLATFPEFLTGADFIRLLIVRFFFLPSDSAHLPFFLSSIQPILQQQVASVLLEWITRYHEDFVGDSGVAPMLASFLTRTLASVTDAPLRETLEHLDSLLRVVKSHPDEALLPCTPLGRALRESAGVWTDLEALAAEDATHAAARALVPSPLAPQSLLLDPGPLRSIVQVHAVEVARQLALIDFALFVRVRRAELLHQAFVKPDPRRDAPHVQALIDHFNTTSSWAMTQVLIPDECDERAVVICMLIDVARECEALGNYSAMMAVVSGLQGAAVSRLRHTWALLPQAYVEHWEDLKRALSMEHNYHAYRNALRRRSAPAVPYLGVFLQDLVFIDDGNPSLVAPHSLVNMAKHAMNAGVLSELLRLQAAPYEFHTVEPIQAFVQSAAGIDEDTLFARSLALEPRDAKPRKRPPVAYTPRARSTWMHVELDSPDVLDDLVANTSVEEFDAGALVLRAGHASKFMYYIVHGIVQVHLPHGPTILLSDGQLVGEMAVFMGQKRSANVSAVTHVTLLKLASKNLGVLLRKHPKLQENLAALARFRADDIKRRASAPPTPPEPKWYATVSQPSALRWTRAAASDGTPSSSS